MKLMYPDDTSNPMAMAFSTGDNETDFNQQDDPEEFDMIWDTMQRELNYADEREEQKDKPRFTPPPRSSTTHESDDNLCQAAAGTESKAMTKPVRSRKGIHKYQRTMDPLHIARVARTVKKAEVLANPEARKSLQTE